MRFDLIDTSVFCGHWPFRQLSIHTPYELKQFLLQRKVRQAWITGFETVFHPDPMQMQRELGNAAENDPFYVPVGVSNVTLATWKHDLKVALEKWKFQAIKLIPNYHQFDLGDDRVAELLAIAEKSNVPVCVQMRMQDERSHHPLVKVPGVSAVSIVKLAAQHPRNRFLVCAGYLNELKTFKDSANIWAEISFVESGQALVGALKAMNPQRLVFGSHSPLYYFEAQAKKLDVDDVDATQEQLKQIAEKNATELKIKN